MTHTPKYFIVDADAMPEVFRKVAQAKQLLELGEATAVNAAAQAVGIGVVDQFILGRGAVYSLRSGRVLVFASPSLVTDMSLSEYKAR